jgi:para-nitrobenzyl esterase
MTTRRDAIAAVLATGVAASFPRGAAAAAIETAATTGSVETTSGTVRGMRAGGVSRFLGIPYGGDTATCRFQPARAPQPWTGVRDCFAFGFRAPQGNLSAGRDKSSTTPSPLAQQIASVMAPSEPVVPESEDCLVLNIFTPDASPARKRPVMVWLHGGGFFGGSSSVPSTDGGGLCHQGDVVVVTLNHRLNALGYLYLGALHADFADSGNVGQLDIVLALQWVHDNIAMFGGDPGSVTIFGVSGGGGKVGTLLGMPPAKGLFHKAIQESGPVVTMCEKADAVEIAERTLAGLGVAEADVHQLQTMDYKKVIAAATVVQIARGAGSGVYAGLQPTVDGRSLPAHPFSPKATDVSRNVPLIIGTNKDEMTVMLGMDPNFGKMTEDQASQRITAMLGKERGPAAFEFYKKLRPNEQPTYWVASTWTDRLMLANSIVQAERKAAQHAAPVFMYRFDWGSPLGGGVLGAYHGSEVPFVFNNGQAGTSKELADTVSQAWVNFARTGNPSQKTLAWPGYDAELRRTMIINTPSKVVSDPARETREFWTKTIA